MSETPNLPERGELPGLPEPRPGAASPSNWNAPNIITVARMLLTPVCVWLLLAGDPTHDGVAAASTLRWFGATLFVVAIATDWVDGYLARKFGQVTNLGKLLDPIADKLLTGAALVCLVVLHELPWWVCALMLVREWGVTVDRLIRASKHVVIAAAWLGKVKTAVQAVAISLALLPLEAVLGAWIHPVQVASMSAALVLTLWSGVTYVQGAIAGAGEHNR